MNMIDTDKIKDLFQSRKKKVDSSFQ